VLPGNADLTAAEVKLMDALAREQRLKECLAPGRRPLPVHPDRLPALAEPADPERADRRPRRAGADAVRVLRARRPVGADGHHPRGQGAAQSQLEVEGILRTMYDVRNNLANDVSAQLTQHFGDKVFRTMIPRNVRVAEAPSHGQSIIATTAARAAASPTSALPAR
jgi:chromosome partitioning protein